MTPASFSAGQLLSTDPPGNNDVEVSVIGPGFGECVVVHLGSGQWMIVDSCVRSGSSTPAAIEYLEGLGTDISRSVKLIVATHWHDDHVRGISTLFERCESAQFFASRAIRAPEFLALANRRPITSRFSSGVEELAKVRAISDFRRLRGGRALGLVGAVQRIWHTPQQPVQAVWSLSPSDEDASRSVHHIASLLPTPPETGATRVPSLEPNDGSVVLLLETTAGAVLLGADLEHVTGSRTRGWHAIVDDGNRPADPATLFKAAHHGSANADCPEVWEHLVAKQAVCVVTPFERGRTPLPRSADRARIRSRTDLGFITSTKRAPEDDRERIVRKMISEATRSFRPEELLMGHVRARSTGTAWTVAASSNAASI